MATRSRIAKASKTPAFKSAAPEGGYPFPYLGHGLGSASNDLVVHAVFERDARNIPDEVFAPFPVTRTSRCVTVHVPDNQLSYAVTADPDFADDPNLVTDEKMYEAYEVERTRLKESAQHLLVYVHGLDTSLRRANALVPILACARLQGPRAKLTRWHAESLLRLPEIFEHVAAAIAESERFPLDYADTNGHTSKARFFCDFYKSILRTRADFDKLDDGQRRHLGAKLTAGIGYGPVTDNFLVAAAVLLKGITQEAAMRELCSDLPSQMRRALEEMNDKWPPAKRFERPW